MTDDYVFITENVEVFKGEEALERLQRKNDLYFLESDKGVVRVPRWRWSEAQRYQHTQWMTRGLDRSDDRNEVHAEHFNGYYALRGKTFARAIELGCGPFTNLRLISQVCDIGECVLVDPLIDKYLNHPNCAYNSDMLDGRVLVDCLYRAPIEELPCLGWFDLVVMVNVLEHCYDAHRVMDKAEEMVRPGGYIVFYERGYTRIEDMLRMRYDAGHPLKLHWLTAIVDFTDRFTTRHRRWRCKGNGVDVYFIGHKPDED